MQDAGEMAKGGRGNKRQAALNSGLARGGGSSSATKASVAAADDGDEAEFDF
jgi:hypothetical protein